VRSEIEEAAPGKWLSAEVNNHVVSCVACETLLREQTSLRGLVSSLGTVQAPGDFDFRLRARLAEEKRARDRSFGPASFSFGLGSAAAVTLLILIGSGLMFVSLRNRPDSPTTSVATTTGNAQPAAQPTTSPDTVATVNPQTANGSEAGNGNIAGVKTNSTKASDRPRNKRYELTRSEVAVRQDRQGTRDSSSTTANVIKRDQLYASSAFPIDAGYQSLKVSVDAGRGVSRTISLPAVSFGSQSALSQGTSPLMASARGAW
jgi:hypothetical protein